MSESATARLAEMVDLPTPPLPEETQMMCLTFGIRRGCGGPEPRRGMVGGMRWLLRGRPSGFSCEYGTEVEEIGRLDGPAIACTSGLVVRSIEAVEPDARDSKDGVLDDSMMSSCEQSGDREEDEGGCGTRVEKQNEKKLSPHFYSRQPSFFPCLSLHILHNIRVLYDLFEGCE